MAEIEPSGVKAVNPDGTVAVWHIRWLFAGTNTFADCPVCLATVAADCLAGHCERAHDMMLSELHIPPNPTLTGLADLRAKLRAL